MKYVTDLIIGKQEYSVDQEMLNIDAVRVNGKKVKAEFKMILPKVPTKGGRLSIDVEVVTINRKRK